MPGDTPFYAKNGIVANASFTANSSQVALGANVVLTPATVTVLTSTGNVVINSTAIFIGNSTVNAIVNSTSSPGGANVNATYTWTNNHTFNANLNVGANIQLTQSTITVLSTTSNIVVNSTSIFIGNSTVNTVINSTSSGSGGTTNVNATYVWANVHTFNANVNFGANAYFNANSFFQQSVFQGITSFQANTTFSGTINEANAAILQQTLTDAATINWNGSLGRIATVTLAGNRTMAAPTNLFVGTYILHVVQDATGSRTITWNSVFKWTQAVAPVLTTAATRRDIISFVCDGTNMYGSFLPDVR